LIALRNDRSTEFRKTELKTASSPCKFVKSCKIPLIRHPSTKNIHDRPRQNLRREMPTFAFRSQTWAKYVNHPRIFSRMLNYEQIPQHSTKTHGEIRLPRFFPIHMLQPADYTVGGLRIDSCINGESLMNRWKQSISSEHHMGFDEQGIISFAREKYAMLYSRLFIVKSLDLISTY